MSCMGRHVLLLEQSQVVGSYECLPKCTFLVYIVYLKSMYVHLGTHRLGANYLAPVDTCIVYKLNLTCRLGQIGLNPSLSSLHGHTP